ncbi:AMP-binding protein [Alphaproteobacteria bacterium]|nr:AMP-binding protein [Alphaproteobacteria bacterium]
MGWDRRRGAVVLTQMVHTLAQKLDAAAQKDSEKIVIVGPSGELSWRELDGRAGAVAQSLHDKGIKPADRVLIATDNITDTAIGIIAGLKVGAAITPMNPRLSESDKHAIMDVLMTDHVMERLPPGDAAFSAATVDGESPSIILFTSGSTGAPKGVVLSQRAVSAGMELWVGAALQLRSDDVVISVLPLAHSYGLFGTLLSPLLVGATSVLVPRFSPEKVLTAIKRHKATIFSGVATMFRRILDSDVLRDADLSSLRFCTSGAAPCPWDLAQEWREVTGIRIVRGYGMSELFRPIFFSPDDTLEFPDSIGRAPKGVTLRLVDEKGAALDDDPDAVGELWIHSPTCMTKYVDRPEDTDAVLENGWFKTGDLARITQEGLVCIVGRKKEIILRGGYTIAAGEIEAALLAHPGVAEAAIIPIPDRELGEEICAFVAFRPDREVTEDELVDFCKLRLSSYKYPRIFHFLAELPKNATGKIDKTQLSGQGADRDD